MSKVEVDQVTQQSGTTLTVGGGACKTAVVDATTVTLGRCGGTVSLASGATQTGFGRTGTVDWITTPKVTGDSPINAASGKGYFLNTSAGTITINLPAASAGDIVSMADYAATWQTYAVTVSPNGSEKIGGIAQSATLNTEGQAVTFVYVDAVQGWVNTMDSTSNVRGNPPYMVASVSGACNTLVTAPDCANMKVATFLNPGTFTVCSVALCAADNIVSHVVVAGGGGGGANGDTGGGGGAGGYREVVSPTSPYSGSPLNGYACAPNRVTVTATGYPIAVGAGGAGATSNVRGTVGVDSTFSITSAGGGGGGASNSPLGPAPAGGSGGGGGSDGCYGSPGGAGNTPTVSPAQGFNGGKGRGNNNPLAGMRYGGGGGGAAALGSCAPTTASGTGGAGTTTSINGTPTARGGGGGGGAHASGSDTTPPTNGGAGGGGAGQNTGQNAENGTANTGGGGGGSGSKTSPCYNGGTGGSGIVIIRYRFQ